MIHYGSTIERLIFTTDEVLAQATQLEHTAEFHELCGEDGKAAEIRERLRKLGV